MNWMNDIVWIVFPISYLLLWPSGAFGDAQFFGKAIFPKWWSKKKKWQSKFRKIYRAKCEMCIGWRCAIEERRSAVNDMEAIANRLYFDFNAIKIEWYKRMNADRYVGVWQCGALRPDKLVLCVSWTVNVHIIWKAQRDWVTPQPIFKAITLTCLYGIFCSRSAASTGSQHCQLYLRSVSCMVVSFVLANVTSVYECCIHWRLYVWALRFVCALVYFREAAAAAAKKPLNHLGEVKNWRWKERTTTQNDIKQWHARAEATLFEQQNRGEGNEE